MTSIFLDRDTSTILRKSGLKFLSAVTKPETLEDLMDGIGPPPGKRDLKSSDENLIADNENPYR
jgi:hypothetical protein